MFKTKRSVYVKMCNKSFQVLKLFYFYFIFEFIH